MNTDGKGPVHGTAPFSRAVTEKGESVMLRGVTAIVAFLGALLLLTLAAWAATDDAVVSMTATVDSFGEWEDAAPTIASGDWTGSVDGTTINQVGEDLTVTKAMVLYANANMTLSQTAGANSGILTVGAAADTLTTSYQIQGDVDVPDAAYKAAGAGVGEFFNAGNTYTVTHVSGDGSYAIDLLVQAESDDAAADDAGDYTAGLTITATW